MAGEIVVEGPVEMTMEEMEQQLGTPAVAEPVLAGDDVPEEFRGKTAKEVAAIASQRAAALKISEEARLRSVEERVNQPAAPAPAPAAPPPPAGITREEFATLYESDPIAALEAYGEQRDARLIANLESRLGSLASGAASTAEAAARAQFATEFELFGPEIAKMAAQVPNKAFLATPDGWQQLISFVRGQPGNFDKLVDHKTKLAQSAHADPARARERDTAGFTSTARVTAPIKTGDDPSYHGLDETQRKVADTLGMSLQDYAKWARMS